MKPQDKELLADPAMIYGSDGQAGRHEAHVLENREGSTGSATSGGRLRMQLKQPSRGRSILPTASVAYASWLAIVGTPSAAAAQSGMDATSTVFYEAGGPLHMTVVNPAVHARVAAGDMLSFQAGWEADVVTGASVAVVDAPGASSDVDAITSATKLEDQRHVLQGGVGLGGETTRLQASYGYGFERDYRSHGLTVTAAAELFDRNTTLELSYGRGWGRGLRLVAAGSRTGGRAAALAQRRGLLRARARAHRARHRSALRPGRVDPSLDADLQHAVELVDTARLRVPVEPLSRGVARRAAAQEHHPNERARYGTTLSARVWLRPLGGALQLAARLYRDTWDVRSASGELAYERGLGALLRLRARARYYRQSGAAFYSDDYALAPRGQYFTGDRELSPFASWLAGARLS